MYVCTSVYVCSTAGCVLLCSGGVLVLLVVYILIHYNIASTKTTSCICIVYASIYTVYSIIDHSTGATYYREVVFDRVNFEI